MENYRQPLSLTSFANEVGYSPFHIQRRFLDAYGETPHALVTRLRMEEARRLLGRSGMTVGEVCVEVGYQSQATFSRMFGERFGVSPSQYRRTFAIPGVNLLKVMPACFRFTW